MAFDVSNDYSDFDEVESGQNGTTEGLIRIEGSASAFRYRKHLVVSVFLDAGGGDSIVRDIIGNWKVRVREDNSRNPDGSYAGTILFEQEVKWTARVVAIVDPFFGTIGLVTWQPLGDAGSGKSKTSIVNAEACAVVEDTSDAAQMAAYGATGSWRFLDNNAIRPTFTPSQKYDADKGFTLFTAEGVATVGKYYFFADWQSQDYLLDFGEGAIFETVFDNWQVGTVEAEANYQVAYKAGDELFDAIRDTWTGQGFWFHRADGAMRCARTRRDESFVASDDDPVVLTGAFGAFRAIQQGHNLIVLHQKGAGIGLRYSVDDGREWEGFEDMVTGVTQIDAIRDTSGGTLLILGKAKTALAGPEVSGAVTAGDLVRVLLCSTEETQTDGTPKLWQVKEICKIVSTDATPLPTKPKGRLTRIGTLLEWLVQDGADVKIWHSSDNGLMWTFVPATN